MRLQMLSWTLCHHSQHVCMFVTLHTFEAKLLKGQLAVLEDNVNTVKMNSKLRNAHTGVTLWRLYISL